MELPIKQKMILATIQSIEKEGINAVTIRSIAREADVNSAAISYYFGSKDKLIEETFEYIEKDFMMDFIEIINKGNDLKAMIEELLVYMFQGTVKYPNITRAILYEPFINNNYSSFYISKLNVLCQELYNRIGREYGTFKGNKPRVDVVQLIASSLFMGIFPCFFKDFLSMDLNDDEAMRDYIGKTADVFISTIMNA